MNILVLGAAGMIGRKLIERLLSKESLRGGKISAIHAFDVVGPGFDPKEGIAVKNAAGDISDPEICRNLVASKPDVIFHLAAIVSGEAEADFDKGYRINFDGTRHLFDAIREQNYNPRVIYASSIAVFGAPFPETIQDEFHLTPLTSYGTQKAIGELLLNDFTRRGIFDGVGLRFPTIVVRPGQPNKAASGFFSNIIREPLAGKEAVLPVGRDVRHWLASPRAAVDFCIRAAEIDGNEIGPRRCLTLPGVTVTVGEMIEALGRIAGEKTVSLIREEPNETIKSMVANWPRQFDALRAKALGFQAEKDFETIIRAHIEDELGGIVSR